MKQFGLIGYPLSHSFSQKYFSEKFEKEGISNCSYSNFPIESIDLLQQIIEGNKDLVGLNVTIPYKQQVMPFLNEIDKNAAEIGAVNTIKITREGSEVHLKGFNTDEYGFRKPLEDVISENHKKALVLGTGGASKAVNWVFKSLNIETTFVSRSPKSSNAFSYDDLTEGIIADFQIIVNTTPIGMYPNVDNKPAIPYEGIGSNHVLYDLVYNPLETQFLKEGLNRNAKVINGLPMLHLQAERAWQIWNDL